MRLPGAGERPFDPDDHLVRPETRQEVVRGQIVEVSPARPGHGDIHSRLDSLVHLSVAPGYVSSTDLLTRRSEDSDFATDVSVRKAGRNPETGHRHLEELSFEIFFTQTREEARQRARDVVTYGVRRMFGIFVRERYPDSDVDGAIDLTVAEWSAERDDWIPLSAGDVIDDPCLRTPLPVAALVDATAADEAIARALVASRNPVIERVALQSRLDARRSALFEVLSRRDITLTAVQRTQIERCDDLPTLERWFSRALTARSASELLS